MRQIQKDHIFASIEQPNRYVSDLIMTQFQVLQLNKTFRTFEKAGKFSTDSIRLWLTYKCLRSFKYSRPAILLTWLWSSTKVSNLIKCPIFYIFYLDPYVLRYYCALNWAPVVPCSLQHLPTSIVSCSRDAIIWDQDSSWHFRCGWYCCMIGWDIAIYRTTWQAQCRWVPCWWGQFYRLDWAIIRWQLRGIFSYSFFWNYYWFCCQAIYLT